MRSPADVDRKFFPETSPREPPWVNKLGPGEVLLYRRFSGRRTSPSPARRLSGLCSARELVRERAERSGSGSARTRVGGRMVRTSVARKAAGLDLGVGHWIRADPQSATWNRPANNWASRISTSYAVGQTTVSYDGALSVVDDFPPENVIPSVSATDIAGANRVWERFYRPGGHVNIESPWLGPVRCSWILRRSQRGWTMPQRRIRFRFGVKHWVATMQGYVPDARYVDAGSR